MTGCAVLRRLSVCGFCEAAVEPSARLTRLSLPRASLVLAQQDAQDTTERPIAGTNCVILTAVNSYSS